MESAIEHEILSRLYEAWSESDQAVNLFTLRQEQKWDEVTFEKVIHRLKDNHLISPSSIITHEITSFGILHVEESGITGIEAKLPQIAARNSLLKALALLYDAKGPRASEHYEQLARECDLDEMLALRNLEVLNSINYIGHASVGFFRLHEAGLIAIQEYNQKVALSEEFERISEFAAQARGRMLEKLLAQVAEREGWRQEVGARTQNEEIDIVIYQGREYYFIESKWEKKAVEAGVIFKLVGKLATRWGVNGIAVSMSGFSQGAELAVKEHANTRTILLFGPEDVKAIVYGESLFNDLLNQKYHEFMMKKVIYK